MTASSPIWVAIRRGSARRSQNGSPGDRQPGTLPVAVAARAASSAAPGQRLPSAGWPGLWAAGCPFRAVSAGAAFCVFTGARGQRADPHPLLAQAQ